MLSSLCRVVASLSLRHRRCRLELWLYDLLVPKISQDMLEVIFADLIFQYLFDSSASVWYFMMFYILFYFCFMVPISELECYFTNALINTFYGSTFYGSA